MLLEYDNNIDYVLIKFRLPVLAVFDFQRSWRPVVFDCSTSVLKQIKKKKNAH